MKETATIKMKGLEFTQSQIKSLENGGTMFMLPLDNCNILHSIDKAPIKKGEKFFVQKNIAYQSLDKVYCKNSKTNREIASKLGYKMGICKSAFIGFYIKPLSLIGLEGVEYLCNDLHLFNAPYNHNSTYKKIELFNYLECVDVRILKVKDCPFPSECEKFYNQQMQEQNITRTYEDNDYVFLLKVKRI